MRNLHDQSNHGRNATQHSTLTSKLRPKNNPSSTFQSRKMTLDAQSAATHHASKTSHSNARPNMHSTVAIRTTTADPDQSTRKMTDYAQVNLDMGSLKSRLKKGMSRKATYQPSSYSNSYQNTQQASPEGKVKVIAHSRSY